MAVLKVEYEEKLSTLIRDNKNNISTQEANEKIQAVSVDSEKFQQANSDIEVAVGMEGTAEVKVKERRIVEFFLEPLVEHFDGSLKVR